MKNVKTQSTKTQSTESQSGGSILLGVLLILLAIGAGWFAGDIRTSGFQSEGDPGPRALPWLLAAVIGVFGIWELALALIGRVKNTASLPVSDPAEVVSPGRLCQTLGLTLLYLLSLAWAGFFIASACFAAALISLMEWRRGTSPWKIALLASTSTVLLMLSVYGLFVLVFRVVLP